MNNRSWEHITQLANLTDATSNSSLLEILWINLSHSILGIFLRYIAWAITSYLNCSISSISLVANTPVFSLKLWTMNWRIAVVLPALGLQGTISLPSGNTSISLYVALLGIASMTSVKYLPLSNKAFSE